MGKHLPEHVQGETFVAVTLRRSQGAGRALTKTFYARGQRCREIAGVDGGHGDVTRSVNSSGVELPPVDVPSSGVEVAVKEHSLAA